MIDTLTFPAGCCQLCSTQLLQSRLEEDGILFCVSVCICSLSCLKALFITQQATSCFVVYWTGKKSLLYEDASVPHFATCNGSIDARRVTSAR